MIFYALLACLVVAVLVYPSQVKRQVQIKHEQRQDALVRAEVVPIRRTRPVSSPAPYQSAHTPSQGSAQVRQ